MPDAILSDRERSAVRQLVSLMADRSRAEVEIVQTYTTTADDLNKQHQEAGKTRSARYDKEKRAEEKSYRTESTKLESDFKTEYTATEKDYKDALRQIVEKAEANEVATRKALQEAVWLTETVFEATETQPIEQFQQARKDVNGKLEEFQNIEDKSASLLKQFRQQRLSRSIGSPADPTAQPTAEDAQKALNDAVNDAQTNLDRLQGLFVPRVFQSFWPILFVLVVMLISAGTFGLLKGWQIEQWIGAAAGVGAAAAIVLLAVLYVVARSQASHAYRPLREAIERGRAAATVRLKAAEETRDRHKAQLIEQRDRDLRLAHEKYDPILLNIKERREHHLDRIKQKYPKLLEELKAKHEADKQSLSGSHASRLAELTAGFESDMAEANERHARQTSDNENRYRTDWSALEQRWKQGMAEVYATVDSVSAGSAELFKPWSDPSWQNWRPPAEFAPVIRFGQMHVDLRNVPGGLPKDQRLALPGSPQQFDLPAFLAFPDLCSMLISAGADGRDEAVQTLQTVMFRLLTTLPPGKVRFTIIDPVGLGQNFAGFMHLADYEGAFVADKIWTEDRHIEQRLLDLTEHMENVIQKYLRNEYETIGEYNVDAGEIAEPFRFLVIANFPVNFSETAARRLASIINSGARCGVYTLITVDTRQPLPQGIQMGDLERNSVRLVFDPATGTFVWHDEDYKPYPLILDPPPAEEFVTEKLHLIGRAAKESTRVEVPFDVIAPEDREVWSLSTTSELRVALGRAGATKLQHLTLGVGTSQHALVAGKTGSGKSTLLHALVTNLALWYPPDEVEFYLVDFKKGVEFKTYATHALPHARAVAIESDREFGLSVLQRLDAELKHRGNIFRDLGVQDLAGYRKSEVGKQNAIPRTLLIIDEFQELFTEDDKIGQDAALLLDRLVRQGRAFGMHVLLGSQTLGGAYSLARSTINQMAVRIALQCSEADSYLILSDDNAAARLLSRPGEAIYNDASGMVEGNNPFQIVWLPDEKREQCLARVNAAARRRNYQPPEPQIVFEGNVPAEIDRNHLLSDLLSAPQWPAMAPTAPRVAWLGEAIAIKDPTAATFRRQSGNNLIVVGQREEASLAMLATSLISLAAQHSPDRSTAAGARFFILDGSADDSSHAGYLAKLASMLPHQIVNVGWRDVPTAMAEIGEDLDRRTQSHHETDNPAIYVLVYGLQRYRMLRQEDDFGMSSSSFDGDAPPRPEKLFGTIIREGPAHGVHTLAWCDTVNNLNRSLDRSGLKEFEIRVLFQMGATDSSNLIDSPVASRLGLHRALFFSEEQGQLEKFRPYALPDDQWLAEMSRRLAERAGAGTPAA